MFQLHRRRSTRATQCGTHDDLDLPAHALSAGRLQLPASADLLGIWRRGDRTVRTVGRRMDDAGAVVALPALGYVGHRQRSARKTSWRTMVSAVALWPLARCQRGIVFLAARRYCVAFRP